MLDIGGHPSDDPDLRVRKRSLVATVLALMGFALLLGVANAFIAEWLVVVLSAIQFAVFGIAILIFGRTRSLALLFVAMSGVGTSVLFMAVVSFGGMHRGAYNFIWLVLIPMAAVLFVGVRAAGLALVAVVLVVVAAVVTDLIIEHPPPPEESLMRLVTIALFIVLAAAIALGVVVFIDGERLKARAESDALLLNILPRPIADRLKQGERVIADHYERVTVLFCDMVDFTRFAAHQPPERVVALLNEVFSRFDTLAEESGLEKIKTMGDAYMVVAGAPEPRTDDAGVILNMAVAMHRVVESIDPSLGGPIRLRIGVATGPAVAGVIGHRKFSYDLWGDAVNLASRMESTTEPGTIQVAESTWALCSDSYSFTPRDVEVKGLGLVRTYLVDPV